MKLHAILLGAAVLAFAAPQSKAQSVQAATTIEVDYYADLGNNEYTWQQGSLTVGQGFVPATSLTLNYASGGGSVDPTPAEVAAVNGQAVIGESLWISLNAAAPSGYYSNFVVSPKAYTLTGVPYLIIAMASSPAPAITTEPAGAVSLNAGETLNLSVTAPGATNYQWYVNGQPIPGQTSATLAIPGVSTGNSGAYTVVVSNPTGSTTSTQSTVVVTGTGGTVASEGCHLSNISTRGVVGSGGNIMIAGFVVAGNGTETVLIRADGPSLAAFGVAATLAKPELQVIDSSGKTIATITGWGMAPTAGTSTAGAFPQAATASDMSSVGAFGFLAGSADSAMKLTLPPGSYTAQVLGADGGTGVVLVEVYEMP